MRLRALLRRLRRRRRYVVVDRDEFRAALGLRPCDPDPTDPTAAIRALNDAYATVEADLLLWLSLDAGDD